MGVIPLIHICSARINYNGQSIVNIVILTTYYNNVYQVEHTTFTENIGTCFYVICACAVCIACPGKVLYKV